jgi:hypothetical protein
LVRGPYPGTPGHSHLPWWSSGLGSLWGKNPGNFYYLGGTSVTGVAAQMLEEDAALTQADVESILKNTALPIVAGSMSVFDISPTPEWYTYSWELDGLEATGAGLIQADAAVVEAVD